jgi:hypothetical protein
MCVSCLLCDFLTVFSSFMSNHNSLTIMCSKYIDSVLGKKKTGYRFLRHKHGCSSTCTVCCTEPTSNWRAFDPRTRSPTLLLVFCFFLFFFLLAPLKTFPILLSHTVNHLVFYNCFRSLVAFSLYLLWGFYVCPFDSFTCQ